MYRLSYFMKSIHVFDMNSSNNLASSDSVVWHVIYNMILILSI